MTSTDTRERRSNKKKAWARLVDFCDACGRAIDPRRAAQRRREEAKLRGTKNHLG